MKDYKSPSRRTFFKQTTLGLGIGIAGVPGPMAPLTEEENGGRKSLPREVFIATIDLKGFWQDATMESRLKNALGRMEEVAGLGPDIVCLPELFSSIGVKEAAARSLPEFAEEESALGVHATLIAEFARKNNCYVVCPIATKSEGRFHNSSLLIDRKGSIAGVYHKMHPTKSEIIPNDAFKGGGITPGALDQPVIETGFGKIGLQICYDANWFDGWDNYRKQGAEIIFFSSAFPGGRMLNFHALKNQCYIVSSTWEDARIVDKSGKDIATSSTFVRYAWARINLEKENVDTWPTRDVLPDIFAKYGERLEISVWDTNGIITIASLDPALKVKDVLKEYQIPTVDEGLDDARIVQDKYRL